MLNILVLLFYRFSDTTPKSTPSAANGFSEENQEGQVSPTLSKEVGGVNAKEGGGSKNLQVIEGNPEQVQAAKDFIWGCLSEIAKNHYIRIAHLTDSERHSLYSRGLSCYLSAKVKEGLIYEEIAVLSTPSI